MEYNIPAKPTKYNGRQYRSRLEARWAAFFDLVGWKYEYEPTEIGNRNPDFFIKCTSATYNCSTIIVEVKPSPYLTKEYMDLAYSDYYDYPAHILFLNENPFYIDKPYDCCCIGIGSQYWGGEETENKRSELHDLQMKCYYDFGSQYMNYDGMIEGSVERKKFISSTDRFEIGQLNYYWQEAANQVMFLKP